MTSLLKPSKLKSYQEIVRLLIKYGRSDLVKGAGLDDDFAEEVRSQVSPGDPSPDELAADLERMGPVYIKLGQVLSSRADLLPEPYLDALSRLQDNLAPVPYAEIAGIVEEELGVRLSKAFSWFDEEPTATASLGQVHRAALRDGRPVVVKVQRPGVREQVAQDLDALESIAEMLDKHTDVGRRYQFGDMLGEFRASLAAELDYTREASHLQRLHANLREFQDIVVPLPIADYYTARVLTMERVEGKKITSLSPMAFQEIDGHALADELLKAYLKQILVDGFFHADPHPGNVFVTDDGRLALIDLGMVGFLSPEMQQSLLKLLMAVSEARTGEAADLAIEIGRKLEDFDEPGFREGVDALVLRNHSARVEDRRIGRAIFEFSRVGIDNGLRLPSELTLLAKTLLNLDEIGRKLDPTLSPNEAIQRHAAEITQERMLKGLTTGNLMSTVLESKEFVEELPGRLNKILDNVAQNRLKIEVEAIDEATLIEGFQKVANRITTGLVVASLIIGASMLMRVQTRFQILGYPGLAMLLFLAAAAGGAWLVVSILMHDRDGKRGG